MSRRGGDDDDDKYSKAKKQNIVSRAGPRCVADTPASARHESADRSLAPRPPPASREMSHAAHTLRPPALRPPALPPPSSLPFPSRISHADDASRRDVPFVGGPGPDGEAVARRVRGRLDVVSDRLSRGDAGAAESWFGGGGDDSRSLSSSHNAAQDAMDRLAFHAQVKGVSEAFGALGHDAAEDVGSLAHKAAELTAQFQASQYAAKWMPVETLLTMKPTYVKVPAQSVERIKFFERADLEALTRAHVEEKETVLAENAGLRSMLGLEERASEQVQELRETEDGVNRALLLSAVEEIKRLKTRVAVLEGEAARHRVHSSGFGFLGGGGGRGGDSDQMAQKLTKELARLEEDNGRQRWMIGEKDKQIKDTQAKFAASEAYALREKLQESQEALQVAANLQAEQLQYLEDNALAKLTALDDQIADVADDLETKIAHLAQLKTAMRSYWEKGDERLVPVMVSLAGFSRREAEEMARSRALRESKTVAGLARGLGRFGAKLGGDAVEKLIAACAPPPGPIPKRGDVLRSPERTAATPNEQHRLAPSAASDEANASNAASAASTPAKPPPSPLDGGFDGGYDGDGDASTAPPTAEKMPRSPGGRASNASSAAATPTKPMISAETTPANERTNPSSDDAILPSPPAAATETPSKAEALEIESSSALEFESSSAASTPTSTPGPPNPARARVTGADRARREREKRERRERIAGAKARGSSGAHGGGGGEHSGSGFVGFEDEAAKAKEAKARVSARPALPEPKLLGKAAERQEARRREEAARKAALGGFAGFGDDASDSDSD